MAYTKKYELTPDHRAQLVPWAQRWIANAMNVAAMTDADRAAMRVAIQGLYKAANLPPPPIERIVFVPSPFVARFAGGFASAIWWLRRNGNRHQATEQATLQATWEATEQATRQATRQATLQATGQATLQATWEATVQEEDWITGVSIDAMRELATALVPEWAALLLRCATDIYWHGWDGGNQWSGWAAYLSFFRHVAQLPLDYVQWQHYETAAMHAGPRVMHADFCVISDRPSRLRVDAQNRPHCEDGPFCAWHDGTALWAWHGTRVPAWIITHPERLTVQYIQRSANAEVRRVMLERYGADRFVADSGAIPVHADECGSLYRIEQPNDEPLVLVALLNSTRELTREHGLIQAPDGSWRKEYWIRVPPDVRTSRDAVAWTFGMMATEYRPEIET